MGLTQVDLSCCCRAASPPWRLDFTATSSLQAGNAHIHHLHMRTLPVGQSAASSCGRWAALTEQRVSPKQYQAATVHHFASCGHPAASPNNTRLPPSLTLHRRTLIAGIQQHQPVGGHPAVPISCSARPCHRCSPVGCSAGAIRQRGGPWVENQALLAGCAAIGTGDIGCKVKAAIGCHRDLRKPSSRGGVVGSQAGVSASHTPTSRQARVGTVQVAAGPWQKPRFLHIHCRRPHVDTAALSMQRWTKESPTADRNGIAGVVCGVVLQGGGGVLRGAVHAAGSAAISWNHALIGIGIGGRLCCSEDCIAGSFGLIPNQCRMKYQKSLPLCTTVQEASCCAGG